MAHSSRLVLRNRSPRRATLWGAGPHSDVVQTATAGDSDFVWSLGQTAVDTTTIVRIRGHIALWLSVVTTVGDGFAQVTVGIGIVTGDAFGIGVTAMPGLLEDPSWGGWLYYNALGPIHGLETTELARGPIDAVRIQIDNKAMRKVQPNSVVFGMVSTGVETGAAVLSFAADTRMLVKLP